MGRSRKSIGTQHLNQPLQGMLFGDDCRLLSLAMRIHPAALLTKLLGSASSKSQSSARSANLKRGSVAGFLFQYLLRSESLMVAFTLLCLETLLGYFRAVLRAQSISCSLLNSSFFRRPISAWPTFQICFASTTALIPLVVTGMTWERGFVLITGILQLTEILWLSKVARTTWERRFVLVTGSLQLIKDLWSWNITIAPIVASRFRRGGRGITRVSWFSTRSIL